LLHFAYDERTASSGQIRQPSKDESRAAVTDQGRPALTIVVPAFNEARRLPATLAAIDAFTTEHALDAEVIVADDGSEDDTLTIAQTFTPTSGRYQVLALPHRGKASAVRSGVLAACGTIILFTDADLSTPIHFARDLVAALDAGADVAIGSREGAGATRVREPGYRHFMGRAFNLIVRTLAVPGISDTQCGFKAFRRQAAIDIFQRARLHTGDRLVHGPRVTGFDVEILFLARQRGYTIVEVPVYWAHVPGSKVQPVQDSFRMLLDVLRVRGNAILRRY
jgi:dolichyl-phosphate beta-glucosyltransferase